MSIFTIDESAILARVIAPNEPGLPPSVAAELLKWGFDETDKLRMSDLAEKTRQGTLTPEEHAETEALVPQSNLQIRWHREKQSETANQGW